MRKSVTWPDVEKSVRAWIGTRWSLGIDAVYTETGETVPDEYAVIDVTPGPGDFDTDREIDVEVTVYARTRARAKALATEVDSIMSLLPASGTEEFYVDAIAVRFGFAIEKTPTQTARQASATYTLTVRPQG